MVYEGKDAGPSGPRDSEQKGMEPGRSQEPIMGGGVQPTQRMLSGGRIGDSMWCVPDPTARV